MLPVGPLVSGVPPSLVLSVRGMSVCFEALGRERRAVRPAHALGPSMRVRHSGGSRSGRRARRSGASGDGSAGSGGVTSFGCASSRGSPHLGPRSTRRQARRRRREAMGTGLPPRGGSLHPSPKAAEAAEETAPGAGAGAPAARPPTREATRAVEAPAGVGVRVTRLVRVG
jgi:hypothetical protein